MPLQAFSAAQFALLKNIFTSSGSIEFDDLAEALQFLVGISVINTAVDLTLDESHDVVLVDSTAADVTITLPLLGNKIFEVKFLHGGNNVYVVSPDLIDGEASVQLYDKESITVACDGSTWSIV